MIGDTHDMIITTPDGQFFGNVDIDKRIVRMDPGRFLLGIHLFEDYAMEGKEE